MKTDTISQSNSDQEGLPPPDQAFEWPREAIREGNWLEAARRWAVLRKAYPQNPATWFQGAIAHIEADELTEAEVLLDYARQHFPDNPNALTDTAALAMRLQAWDKAEQALATSRTKYSRHLPTWINSAKLAEHRGNLELARTYYERACECAPERPNPFVQYAEFTMRTKQWDVALKRWQIVRERFPNIPAGYHRAAEAARLAGRSKEARQLLLIHEYGPEIFDQAVTHPSLPAQRRMRDPFMRLLELIWTKAIFNLRSEVQRNYLSYGWWVLEPLLHMVIYYIVFGLLLNHGGKNYPVFLLTGLIPWMWFMKAVNGSSNSILTGQNLLLQVSLPSIVFPLVTVLQTTLKQIPVFLLLLGFLWAQGYGPGPQWLALFPLIIVQTLITTSFGCAVAAIIPFARDLSYLVPTGLTFLMFLSGVFYDYRDISPEWQHLFLSNPIAFLLKSYREVLIDGVLPTSFVTLIGWGVGSVFTCIALLLIYKRLRYVFPRIIMS